MRTLMKHIINIFIYLLSVQTFSMEDNSGDINKEIVYGSFIEAILPDGLVDGVSVKSGNLLINSAQPEEVINVLRNTFAASANLYEKLGLTADNQSVPVVSARDNLGFNINDASEALDHVHKIFGRQFFENMKLAGLDFDKIFAPEEGAEFIDGKLISKLIPEQARFMLIGTFHCMMDVWVDQPLDELQRIWNEGNPSAADYTRCKPQAKNPHRSSKNINSYEDWKGPLVTRFGNLHLSNGYIRSYIDLLGLFYDLFPPEIRVNADTKTVLIKLDHMNNWITQLTNNGILLQTFRQGERSYARPIIFTNRLSTTLPLIHYIVIDKSSSLSPFYKELIGHVNNFIDKLRAVDNTAQIKLIFFGSEIEEYGPFDIGQREDIENIVNQSGRVLGATTKLFAALGHIINDIKNEFPPSEYNISIVCFTDGENNQAPLQFDPVSQQINSFDSLRLPKFFALGFGNKVEQTLAKISEGFHGSYIELKTIKHFDSILQHLNEIKFDRDILEFIYTIGQQKRRVKLPIVLNGDAQPVSIVLPLTNEKLVIASKDGQEIIARYELGKTKNATTTDKIWLLSSQASEIAIAENISIKDKTIKLHDVLSQLVKLQVKRELDRQFKDMILRRIRADIADARNGTEIGMAKIKHRNGIYLAVHGYEE